MNVVPPKSQAPPYPVPPPLVLHPMPQPGATQYSPGPPIAPYPKAPYTYSTPAPSPVSIQAPGTAHFIPAPPQMINGDNPVSEPEGSTIFTTTTIRHAFIKKVYLLLLVCLLFMVSVVTTCLFIPPVKNFCRQHIWIIAIAIVVFLATYIPIICCKKPRRSYPCNYIMLALLTISLTAVVTCITCCLDLLAVAMAAGITFGVVIFVTLFVLQTKIDFTTCYGGIMILGFCFALIGLSFIPIMLYDSSKVLYCVWSGIGAFIMTLYLIVDTQLILGQGQLVINEEDYVFATTELFTDIVEIFLRIALMIAAAGGGGN